MPVQTGWIGFSFEGPIYFIMYTLVLVRTCMEKLLDYSNINSNIELYETEK